MTIAELIEQLTQYDPKCEVLTEGYDCIGEAVGVEDCFDYDDTTKKVLITRTQ